MLIHETWCLYFYLSASRVIMKIYTLVMNKSFLYGFWQGSDCFCLEYNFVRLMYDQDFSCFLAIRFVYQNAFNSLFPVRLVISSCVLYFACFTSDYKRMNINIDRMVNDTMKSNIRRQWIMIIHTYVKKSFIKWIYIYRESFAWW